MGQLKIEFFHLFENSKWPNIPNLSWPYRR